MCTCKNIRAWASYVKEHCFPLSLDLTYKSAHIFALEVVCFLWAVCVYVYNCLFVFFFEEKCVNICSLQNVTWLHVYNSFTHFAAKYARFRWKSFSWFAEYLHSDQFLTFIHIECSLFCEENTVRCVYFESVNSSVFVWVSVFDLCDCK